jgi:hypothetical protein
MGFFRTTLHKFIPAHFHDPFGLAFRLLKTRDPAARFAMGSALAGLALTPLDLALSIAESRRTGRAKAPVKPILFVCGPPRSGTTLVSQVLIANLPVAYFNNLTSLFPRSPLTSNAIFGRLLTRREPELHSYYGRSRYLSGSNDALYLWDRWLGKDRSEIPSAIDPARRQELVHFFGAVEASTGKPLVAKNNNLNAVAHLVAEALPTASFLCMDRDPVYLAQSLLRARREIHGSDEIAYGFAEATSVPGESTIDEVCRQVIFHRELMRKQQATIGASRFRVVSYERFCQAPEETVGLAEKILHLPKANREIPTLRPANRMRVDPAEFAQIEAALERLGASPGSPRP